MFGFLLGQQLPDKLPTILPPTQGNLLAPAVFMCSFVVLADLYVLGVVPAAGPFLVCAFVFVFEVSLGEHRSCARSFPLGLRFLSDGAVLQGRSSCPCTSTPRATGSRWPTVSFSTLAGMRAAPLRSALRRSEVTVWPGSAATRCLNLSLQVGILLGLLHSYVLQLFDEGSANVSGENCVDLDANQSGVQNVLIGC